MEVPEQVYEHWMLLYFGVDALLFVVAVLLWKPGFKPVASGVFVFALVMPVAFLTVLLNNLALDLDAE